MLQPVHSDKLPERLGQFKSKIFLSVKLYHKFISVQMLFYLNNHANLEQVIVMLWNDPNNEIKNIENCSQMRFKIIEDVHTKLDTMPYTKFYYNYLDSSKTLEEIDRLKDMDFKYFDN